MGAVQPAGCAGGLWRAASHGRAGGMGREFSVFCHDANIKVENKRLKATGLGRDAYNVYATKYFAEILKHMAISRKDVISKYGFEHLLKFEKTELPSQFTRWIHVFATEIGAPHGIIQQGSISVYFKEEMMSSYANILHPQIIQGIIDIADCGNIKESGPVAKQNMGIMSKDDRTQKKSSHEYGECSKVNENLKHVKSNINRTIPLVIGMRNNKLPLQPIDENSLSLVRKGSHDALATPDCMITKIVEHTNEKGKSISSFSLEFPLINTFPTGLKEHNSFLQFSVQNGQGTFTRSTSLTGTKSDVGGYIAPPEAGQSNYQMISHMSPIDRTKLFSEVPTKRKADIVDISPTSFGVRQIELAKNADHLYNNLIGPIAKRQRQSIVGVEEVVDVPDDTDNHIIIDELAPDTIVNQGGHDDLIILRPKILLELPFKENERFLVSNKECMHYNSIIELAYTKRIQSKYALTYSMVHCNYVSLGQSLMPTGHVDNFLIPYFCRKFFEDCHPSISGRHHFFPNIGENILNYQDDKLRSIATSFLGAASASRGKRLDLSNTIKNFIKLWEIIFQTDQHNFKIFIRMYPHVPKQTNEKDCGVFATKIMEIWAPPLDLRKIFSHDDIHHIRIQYMNQLFFWKKNTADKSLVTGFNL
ncbi:hypothetical protein VPH35_031990 [Triticum aestivum]